jgi:integrase
MSPYEANGSIDSESYFKADEMAALLKEQIRRCKRGTKRPSYNHELNYAVMSFAFQTGARASEICTVTLPQAVKSLSTGQIRIVGKGGMSSRDRVKRRRYTRNLIISPQLQTILANYIRERETHENDKSTSMLFIGHAGNPINRYTLWHRFQTCCRQAGIEERKLHSTRHTAGMLGYGATKDVIATKALLGHRNIASTMVYVVATDDSLTNLANQIGNSIPTACGFDETDQADL